MGTLLTYHLRERQRSARRSVEHQRGFPWRTPKLALAGGAATREPFLVQWQVRPWRHSGVNTSAWWECPVRCGTHAANRAATGRR